jgi:hypothetical protein
MASSYPLTVPRDLTRTPPAIATGGAKSRGLGFEDDNSQIRLQPLEVISGPKPRVTGTDDGNVSLLRPR